MPPIYHFTDVRNLDDILACAELRCHRTAPTTVDVGNQSIKANRSRRRVDCGPAGMVGDYVPFYYAPRSPMLLNIKSGRVDGVSPDQRRIVYLVSSTEAIYSAGLPCVFSDGNAATTITSFGDDPDDLATHVDWPLMKQRLWHNTPEDGDRMRRRMAEFLVHDAVPLGLFTGIAVISGQVRKSVAALAIKHHCKAAVVIRPAWYF